MTVATTNRADLVFRGGKIITLDAESRIAQAVAINGDRITAVGADTVIASRIGPQTRIVELADRALMPGLTDGHAHLDREGLKGLLPSLSGCRSIRALVERLREIAARTPPGTWIVTMPIGEPPEYAWSESMFEEGRLPNRADLDSVSRTAPILIRSGWGYWSGELPLVSIANSAALALAGVDRHTVSPSPLVKIETDRTGEPTGRVFDNAFQPIAEFTLFRRAPHFTADDRVRTLAESMRLYNAVGTTAVFEGHGAAPEVINAYRRIREQNRQTVRARLVVSRGWSGASDADVMAWVQSEAARLRGKGAGSDEWLGVAGAYAEPATAPGEARLRAACAPQTGWSGFLYDMGLPRESLIRFLRAAARERLRVTGIQAPMLEAYGEVAREVTIDGLRWVIAHPVTLDAEQVRRVRDLGVVITTHTNGILWKRGSDTLASIGREREHTILPIRSLLDAGVTVSLATDNVPISLWPCIWHVIERIDRKTGTVIGPDQRISREAALRCATVHGARLCLDEEARGTIEPGRLADLIVLPEDPLTVAADRIRGLTPDLTLVGGQVVWSRDSGLGIP